MAETRRSTDLEVPELSTTLAYIHEYNSRNEITVPFQLLSLHGSISVKC